MNGPFSGPLGLAFFELDQWLSEQGKKLEVTLVGAFAVASYTKVPRATLDIDTVSAIDDFEVTAKIHELSKKLGLPPDWLSDQAASLTLPDGFFERSEPFFAGQAIVVFVASRQDLIALKASAYVNRGAETLKDIEDLIRLKPSRTEMEFALSFVKNKFSPPIDRDPWKSQFHEAIEVLNDLLK